MISRLLVPLSVSLGCACWLALTLGAASVVFEACFHFDFLDFAGWIDLWRFFDGGGTLPFDFVAASIAVAVFALLGCCLVGLRWRAVHRQVAAAYGVWIGLMMGRLSSWRGYALRRRTPSERIVPPPMSRPPSAGAPIRFEPREAPSAPVATPPPAAAPAIEAVLPPVPRPPPSPIPNSSTPTQDDDLATFGRVMAIFDVWSEPPADWMAEALREELEKLSDAGWELFGRFGPSPVALLKAVLAGDLLPERVGLRGKVEAMLEAMRPPPAPETLLIDDDPASVETSSPAGNAGTPSGLSLGAAWLCELVDNYVTLEDMRREETMSSPNDDGRWDGLFQETGDRLMMAMGSMSDADWASLDRHPDRARRIRFLTDRLREELRRRAEPETQAQEDQRQPHPADPQIATPEVSSVTQPTMARPDHPPAADGSSLDDVLRRVGFAVQSLPALGVASTHPDILACRSSAGVLLRIFDMEGRTWAFGGDCLGAWRSDDGRQTASPCRGIWQRFALMRSLGAANAPHAAVVVVRNGSFQDDLAAAAVIAQQSSHTGVGVVWQEAGGGILPGLADWLSSFASTAI